MEDATDEIYIEILKGHHPDDCFGIMPVKQQAGHWEAFRQYEISIDETDVSAYLMYFLLKHFHSDTTANQNRKLHHADVNTFVYNAEYNFFTYREIEDIVNDIKALLKLMYAATSREDCIQQINKKFPAINKFGYNTINLAQNMNDDFDLMEAMVDFYQRFMVELLFMMKNCTECDTIAMIGPDF